MQVLLTRQKKFNIHNIKDLDKMIKESYKYARKHWKIIVPIFNQEDKEAYFRVSYNEIGEPFVYINIDAWVWTTQVVTEWQLSEILSTNILSNDN